MSTSVSNVSVNGKDGGREEGERKAKLAQTMATVFYQAYKHASALVQCENGDA